MRLAVFSIVNLAVAAMFGLHAYASGFGAGRIALNVIIVMVVIQLAYVLWLVVVAGMQRSSDTRRIEPTKAAPGATPSPAPAPRRQPTTIAR